MKNVFQETSEIYKKWAFPGLENHENLENLSSEFILVEVQKASNKPRSHPKWFCLVF